MIGEQWLEEVAKSCKLPPITSSASTALLPVIEMQTRKVAQQALKFMKRGKERKLGVKHINLALSLNGLEPIYGLHRSGDSNTNAKGGAEEGHETNSLVEFIRHSADIRPAPRAPECHMHWLAVGGVQPLIAENPVPYSQFDVHKHHAGSNTIQLETAGVTGGAVGAVTNVIGNNGAGGAVLAVSKDEIPRLLSKEMQDFYSLVCRAIHSHKDTDSEGLENNRTVTLPSMMPAVYLALSSNMGIQELVPYLSRYLFQQIVENVSSNVTLTCVVIRSIHGLVRNQHLHLEFHIQQLLPALLSVVIGLRVGDASGNTSGGEMDELTHWHARELAVECVSFVCTKYSEHFPDLLARVCKAFVDSMWQHVNTIIVSHRECVGEEVDQQEYAKTAQTTIGCLSSIYGSLCGLHALGCGVTRQLLLSQLPDLMSILSLLEQSISVLLKWQEKDEVDVSNIGVEHKRRRVSRGSTAKAGQAKALACDAINAVKQCHRAIVKILGALMMDEEKNSSLQPSGVDAYPQTSKKTSSHSHSHPKNPSLAERMSCFSETYGERLMPFHNRQTPQLFI